MSKHFNVRKLRQHIASMSDRCQLALAGIDEYLATGDLPAGFKIVDKESSLIADCVNRVVTEACERSNHHRISFSDFYNAYLNSAKYPLSRKAVAQSLVRLGFKPTNGRYGRQYCGLRLRQVEPIPDSNTAAEALPIAPQSIQDD